MHNTPFSTYRLQFNSDFTFEDASRITDYIHALGITHIYASPCLQTTPGSTHGYDVADFKSVNQQLGGEYAYEKYVERLAEVGLGQILDIVPNHMSLTQDNPYWRDVLENGPASRYAEYFDIDWVTREERLRNKVLLPLLSHQYGIVLKAGTIQLARSGARFEVVFDTTRLPVAPASMSKVLATAAQRLNSETLTFLADSLAALVFQESHDNFARTKRQRNQAVLLAMLTRYLVEKPKVMDAIDEALNDINSDLDALNEFLDQQHYRLAHWKAANQDLGYRRFFDINSLIGVRVEDEPVFLDTHERILEWVRSGAIQGVRVDHADGLRDPQLYFERLREEAPDAWIVAEKILARGELLPQEWPVAGTTGYGFANMVSGLFVSPEGLAALDETYHSLLGIQTDYPALVHDKKIAVMSEGLGSDVNRISSIFVEICERDLDHRDYSRADIRHAVREIAACFSVYRTYISPERNHVTDIDTAVVNAAIEAAKNYRQEIDGGLFDFIADVLLLRKRGLTESEFLLQFQQLTGPVMAKGFEDTVLYCYNRLIGLNEVGSTPYDPIVTVEEFHRYNHQAQQRNPERMVTLTTHDTKRSEDVRARLFVISEVPESFAALIDRLFSMNTKYRKHNLPDPNTEYLYYQTLIGSWPLSPERAIAYMEKATREAKQQTSWTQTNVKFEDQMREFIRRTLADEEFASEIEVFIQLIDKAGRINSLSQTLLKCTSPGVPDLYQGSELWDHRLVDPDNRGPVDFEERRQLLIEMRSLSPLQIIEQMDAGLPKLWTIHQSLKLRNEHPDCFGTSSTYEPLHVRGLRSSHVVAFMRNDRVVVVVPRLWFSVAEDWDDTSIVLPDGKWSNKMTGSEVQTNVVQISELFSVFPVALLVKED